MNGNGISFIRVPVELLSLGITSAHELLLLALTVNFRERGLRLTNAEIAELFQMDRRHVPRLIGRLRDRGCVRCDVENGLRILRMTDTTLASPPDTTLGRGGSPKLPRGGSPKW